jgi:hypothetical protein
MANASAFLSQKQVETWDLRSIYASNPDAAILAHEGIGGGANLYQFVNQIAARRAKSELVESGKYEASDLVVYAIEEAIESFCD